MLMGHLHTTFQMHSMLMGHLHTTFQMHSTTGTLGITIKTTNKERFQSHIVTVHNTEIFR